MSNITKQAGQKMSKLSRSKKNLKKDDKKEGKLLLAPLLNKTDLNETSDFKEPMKCSKNPPIPETRQPEAPQLQSTLEHCETIETTETDETVVCQVCSKNISHMNSVRRTQHVNRCIDKIEEIETETQREADELNKQKHKKTPIPDCPMCRRKFKSSAARQTHLKKCASINKMSTEAMLKLVKDQEQGSETIPLSTTNQTK